MKITLELNLAEMLPAEDLKMILEAGRAHGESPEATVRRVLAEKAAALRQRQPDGPEPPAMTA